MGSGGTGVSAASVGIGSVDGFGSIIVNGVRYGTDTAQISLADASALQLGMVVHVTGPVNASGTSGTATAIVSAAELRGPVATLDSANATFSVMGVAVTLDSSTLFGGVPNLGALSVGDTVQVHGLPSPGNLLLATRIEKVGPGALPVLTGAVQGLDANGRRFSIGNITVQYSAAALSGGLTESTLANGRIVRVRSTSGPSAGTLVASQVQPWAPLPTATGTPVNLSGVVTSYASLASFRLLGTPMNASGAQITGGPASAIGNGVRLEVTGTVANGVVTVTKLKIRHVPGTGGPSSFSLSGTVGSFTSPASFRVRGQPVDASASSVVYVNGTAAQLRNGTKVTVTGPQVVDGVLKAERVVFD